MANVGYVSTRPTQSTLDDVLIPWLTALQNQYNIPGVIRPNELHVTLMYDGRNIIDSRNHPSDDERMFSAMPGQIQQFGPKEFPALVLTLESPQMQKYHEKLKNMGFLHSYEVFRPHMTFSYSPEIGPVDAFNAMVSITNLIDVPLWFSDVRWEQLS